MIKTKEMNGMVITCEVLFFKQGVEVCGTSFSDRFTTCHIRYCGEQYFYGVGVKLYSITVMGWDCTKWVILSESFNNVKTEQYRTYQVF